MAASHQDLAVAVASMDSSMRAMQDIFNTHTTQDMEQFSALNASIHEMDEKIDQLLIREAHRSGEFAGVKRSVLVMSFVIASIVSVVGVAVQAFVG